MSQAKASALPPASVIRAAARTAASRSISNTAILAPSSANRWQVAAPIPPPPPVTITTLPDSPRTQKSSDVLEDMTTLCYQSVSYTHLRAHETGRNLVCRLLLEK